MEGYCLLGAPAWCVHLVMCVCVQVSEREGEICIINTSGMRMSKDSEIGGK